MEESRRVREGPSGAEEAQVEKGALALRDSPIWFEHFSARRNIELNFNAISHYIIPIILSRLIAH